MIVFDLFYLLAYAGLLRLTICAHILLMAGGALHYTKGYGQSSGLSRSLDAYFLRCVPHGCPQLPEYVPDGVIL